MTLDEIKREQECEIVDISSTIFNILTGARQHVANYPGVTVEKKTGSFRLKDNRVELVDLPGTHSLTSYTLKECIAGAFLLNDKKDEESLF